MPTWLLPGNGPAGQSGRPGGVHGRRDFLHELVEFVAGKVAHRPEVETLLRPVADIVALDRLRDRPGVRDSEALRDEQIDHMFAALIDDRGHRLAGEINWPAAQE